MYFILNRNIDLVKGKSKALIVDVNNAKTYQIDLKFYRLLQLLKKGVLIEKVSNKTDYVISRLKVLESFKIGYFSSNFEIFNNNCYDVKNLGMVWLVVTNNCNFKCLHCYENANICKRQSILNINTIKTFF